MASGLAALLDDVAAIAKIAAASADDVTAAAGRAGSKAAGVVIDDAAVTPRYVTGITPERELPIIWRITLGSLRNKLIFLLPAAILLSEFAPLLIMPILLLGGLYLSFEGAEKLVEKLRGSDAHDLAEDEAMLADANHEKKVISGAIRTDLILSGEIMAISLNELGSLDIWWQRAIALGAVAVAVTIGVYGVVALIVKMDDIGLHLVRNSKGALCRFGQWLVHVMPKLLALLATVGTVAMLWVGGGIIIHALESFGLHAPYEWIHHLSEGAAHMVSVASGFVGWAVEAFFFGLVGLAAGLLLVPVGHMIHSRMGH